MWLFAANGVAYVLYLVFSGEWRPTAGSVVIQTRRGCRASRRIHHQRKAATGKYNDAQRIAYTGVIVMGALSILSGLAIYKPLQLAWLAALLAAINGRGGSIFGSRSFSFCFCRTRRAGRHCGLEEFPVDDHGARGRK